MTRRTTLLLALALAACTNDVISHDPPDAGFDDAGFHDAGPDAGDVTDPDAGPDCDAGGCGPEEGHPRLWVTANELESLRARANGTNPVFQAGLGTLSMQYIALMDDPPVGTAGNRIPDGDEGSSEYAPHPIEPAAQLFAFLSLVSPDQETRDAYAARAKTLLLHVASKAALGAASGEPFRSPSFASGARAQSTGEALALAADWLYDKLTTDERATIRRAFLHWGRTLSAWDNAPFTNASQRPLRNDPALLDLGDPTHKRLRRALGGHHAFRTRNLALFGLAFDAADDVDDPLLDGDDAGELHDLRDEALGAWLYVTDEALRTDGAGGLPANGFGTVNQALGPTLQLLLALDTAGLANDAGVARFGRQVRAKDHPFWTRVVLAYLASLPGTSRQVSGLGRVYQPASFGPLAEYLAVDPRRAMWPLGLLARHAGDDATVNGVRFIEREVPTGGPSREADRLREDVSAAILAFLLVDPSDATPTDPRPALPTLFEAPAIGRVIARHGTGTDTALVSLRNGWIDEDQHADGLQFDFHRKGEWLTKERSGLGYVAACTDNRNGLTIETSAVETFTSPIALVQARRGSQHLFGRAGQPAPPLASQPSGITILTADAAPLYAYDNGTLQVDDVREARRTLVWLPPDRLVVFDRIDATGPGRAKRFWLNLPGTPIVEGLTVTAPTPGGQRLAATTLLPGDALVDVIQTDPDLVEQSMTWSFAPYDPMHFDYTFDGVGTVRGVRRWRVEAPGGPARTRFLHVLEGLDADATRTPATLVRSTLGDALAGALVGTDAVLFADTQGTPPTDATIELPDTVTRVVVTGLAPGAMYDIDDATADGTRTLRVRTGTAHAADATGTLVR